MLLEPLPAPGLAVFPHYVSSEPEGFTIDSKMFSSDCTISHTDGRPFLLMDSEVMSLSHRKTIRDAATGQAICQVRRDGGDYSAEVQNGMKLLDVQKESMGTSRFAIQFANASAGGQIEHLEYVSDSHWNPRDGVVSWHGRPVATIEKNGTFSSSFVLRVAPGLDPFVIIGLQIAIQDARRTKARRRRRQMRQMR